MRRLGDAAGAQAPKTDVIKPPADVPAYAADAWVSCLCWAIGEAEIVAAFRAATGNQWTPGRSPIEHHIDKATGADARFLQEFVDWFNENIWGTWE